MKVFGAFIENLELGEQVYGKKAGGIHAERVDGYAYGTALEPVAVGDIFQVISKVTFRDKSEHPSIVHDGILHLVFLEIKQLKRHRGIVSNVSEGQRFEALFSGTGLELLAKELEKVEKHSEIVLLKHKTDKPITNDDNNT